jgi:hypothetical protein
MKLAADLATFLFLGGEDLLGDRAQLQLHALRLGGQQTKALIRLAGGALRDEAARAFGPQGGAQIADGARGRSARGNGHDAPYPKPRAKSMGWEPT